MALRALLRSSLVVGLASTCLGVGAAQAHAATPVPATSAIAKVVAPTVATARSDGGPVVMRLAPVDAWGGPVQLRVRATVLLPDGSPSYEVHLPRRPNGSTGWVRSDRVVPMATPWFVVVARARREVRVYRAGRLVRTMGVVVGARATPTPLGEFAVVDRVRGDARAFTGSWVLTIGFSNVLQQFDGGPGVVALHGRGGASLGTPLGSAASHGCVRMDNRDIDWIARRAVAGTPVRIEQ